MDAKRSKNCVVCGDNGLVQKPVPILTIPVKDLHDSTSQLHHIVAREMKLAEQQIMLFSQRRNKTARIEKKQSLRRLHIGAGNIVTAVGRNGADYAEAIVRLSRS
jgi:uncharacterized protein YigA (DUF484 family)